MDKARELIEEFKGQNYVFGLGCLEKTGELVQFFGNEVLLVTNLPRRSPEPQLEMKLKNMPVSLTADMVDEYMKPVLEAALTGDFSAIKTVEK